MSGLKNMKDKHRSLSLTSNEIQERLQYETAYPECDRTFDKTERST